jgi:hypothetical protein
MICPNCRTEARPGKKFCGKCGAALDPPTPAVAPIVPTALRCSKCGSEVSPSKKFCGACGNSIGPRKEETPAGPITADVNPSGDVESSAPEQTRETETSPPVVSEPVESEHRGRKSLVLVTVTAVLVAGVAAALIWVMTTRHTSPEQIASVAKLAVEAPASPVYGSPAEPPAIEAPGLNTSLNSPAAPPISASPPSGASNETAAGATTDPIGPSPSAPAEPARRATDVPPPESTPVSTRSADRPTEPATQVRQIDSAATPTQSLPPRNEPEQTQFQTRPLIPPSLPSAPAYNGPRSGLLVWSGKLDKNDTLTIDGVTPSSGSLQGELPGVPVNFEIDATNIGIRENPGAQNGWKRLVLVSHAKHARITIRWNVR